MLAPFTGVTGRGGQLPGLVDGLAWHGMVEVILMLQVVRQSWLLPPPGSSIPGQVAKL
jgi:hypothetical protein